MTKTTSTQPPLYPTPEAAMNACRKAHPYNSSDYRIVRVDKQWTYTKS